MGDDITRLISPEALAQIDALIAKTGKGAEAMVKLRTEAKKIDEDLRALNTTTQTSKTHWEKLTNTQKEMLAVDRQTQKAIEQLDLAEKGYNKTLLETQNKLNQQKTAQRLSIKNDQAEAGSIQKLKTQMNKLNHERERLNLTTKKGAARYKEITRAIKKSETALKKHDKAIGRSQRHVGAYGRAFGGLTKMLGAFGVMLGGAMIVRGFANLIRLGSKFERTMSKVKAITRASRLEMALLRNDALLLGEATEKTASEVAGLQVELGKLGLTAKQIVKVTGAILDMATASDAELGHAAKVAASTMKGFGKQAKDMQKIVDVMARSFSSSALDITKFETAMATVGPVADVAGESIESTTAYLSVLVDRGLEASTAGTSLRNIFLELAKKGLTMEQAFSKINHATNKNAVALELFGKRSSTAAVILAANADEVERLTKIYNNSAGAAAEMARIMRDNLAGDADQAKSATQALGLNIMNVLNPALRSMVQGYTGAIRTVSGWISQKESAVDAVVKERVEIVGLLRKIGALNEGHKLRKKAIVELNAKYPDLLKNYDLEKIANEDILDLIKEVNKEYKVKVAQAALSDRMNKIFEETVEQWNKQDAAIDNVTDAYFKYIKNAKEGASLQTMMNALTNKRRFALYEEGKATNSAATGYEAMGKAAAASGVNKIVAAQVTLAKQWKGTIEGTTEEIQTLDNEYQKLQKRVEGFGLLDDDEEPKGGKKVVIDEGGEQFTKLMAKWEKEYTDTLYQFEKDFDKFTDEIEAEGRQAAKDMVTAIATEQAAAFTANIEAGFNELGRSYDRNLINYKAQLAEGLITLDQFNELAIQNEFNKNDAILSAQAQHLRAWLDAAQLSATERIAIEEELADIELQIDADKAERKLQSAEDAGEAQKKIQQALYDAGVQLVGAAFEFGKNAREKELQDIKAAKDYELEMAGDNAEKREQIEKKYAKKEADLKTKQAKADKARAMFGAIVNTAQAITAALTVPIAGIALAAIAGVLGAVQIAVIASKPIPQFFTGVGSSPETLAWLGERGREIRIEPGGGMSITPDQAQLTYLKAGTQIISNPETERLLSGAKGFDSLEVMALAGVIKEGDEGIIQAIKEQPQYIISKDKRTVTKRKGRYFMTYLNSKVEF